MVLMSNNVFSSLGELLDQNFLLSTNSNVSHSLVGGAAPRVVCGSFLFSVLQKTCKLNLTLC